MLIALLLLASATRLHLVDDQFDIPAHDWRFQDKLGLHQRAATLTASYRVESGGAVRLVLMTREDVELLSDGKPHDTMASSGPASTGRLRYDVPRLGEYVLVIDNREGAEPAHVHLSVWLDFPRVSGISPQRQLTVILLSFAFFFGVVTWSARKILREINR